MLELFVFSNMLGVIQGWDEGIRKMLHQRCEVEPTSKTNHPPLIDVDVRQTAER
jgi:hypothetical protein